MKILIDKHVLLKPLDQVSKALPSKSPAEILFGILFRADDDGLTLTAGDSSVAIKAQISIQDFELLDQGAIVIPGRKIIEIVKKVTDDISIEVKGLQVTIKSGKSKFEISGLDATEYPEFPEVLGESVTIPGEMLRSLINQTIFATSKQESTPILTGICFSFSENKLKLTGCDRHRLAQVEREISTDINVPVVISSESLNELMKIIDEKGNVELSLAPDRFLAKTQQFSFFSRVLEGTYPEVAKLIPDNFNSYITISTAKFIGAMERVFIVATEEKTNQIMLTVDDELEIESKAAGNVATETLDILAKRGDSFKVAVNAKYVLEALKVIDSENVVIHYVGHLQPIILKGSEGSDDIQFILPYRTAG